MAHTTVLEPLEADQWFVDSPDLREFVAIAKQIISSTTHNRSTTRLCGKNQIYWNSANSEISGDIYS
ncbi:MAG: hypothetical protein NHB32_13525 [Fischerella sp. CENA71]|nr:hypothetical protein [Fischerella sp. CENA71]